MDRLTPQELVALLLVYHMQEIDALSMEKSWVPAMRRLFELSLISFDGAAKITPRGVERVLFALGE